MPFKGIIRLGIALCILLAPVRVSAQDTPARTVTTRQAFSFLSGQAEIGMLFMRGGASGTEAAAHELVEKLIGGQGLTATYRTPKEFGWGGTWEREDSIGRVSMHIGTPDMLGKDQDSAWVMFQPVEEVPIPQALLAHLLSTAESTAISGADTVDLKFGFKPLTPQAKCLTDTTLTIRLGSGALLANVKTTYCDAR